MNSKDRGCQVPSINQNTHLVDGKNNEICLASTSLNYFDYGVEVRRCCLRRVSNHLHATAVTAHHRRLRILVIIDYRHRCHHLSSPYTQPSSSPPPMAQSPQDNATQALSTPVSFFCPWFATAMVRGCRGYRYSLMSTSMSMTTPLHSLSSLTRINASYAKISWQFKMGSIPPQHPHKTPTKPPSRPNHNVK